MLQIQRTLSLLLFFSSIFLLTGCDKDKAPGTSTSTTPVFDTATTGKPVTDNAGHFIYLRPPVGDVYRYRIRLNSTGSAEHVDSLFGQYPPSEKLGVTTTIYVRQTIRQIRQDSTVDIAFRFDTIHTITETGDKKSDFSTAREADRKNPQFANAAAIAGQDLGAIVTRKPERRGDDSHCRRSKRASVPTHIAHPEIVRDKRMARRLIEVSSEIAAKGFTEYGEVKILRYIVVEDCGVIINPLIVDGQVRGGVAQGIGCALYEALDYDDDGQCRTTTLMDYLVPTAAEIPPIEVHHLETPSQHSETGAKGMGEGGTIGAPAAVLNAVNDAVAHLGVEIDRIPVTPDLLRGLLRAAATTDDKVRA